MKQIEALSTSNKVPGKFHLIVAIVCALLCSQEAQRVQAQVLRIDAQATGGFFARVDEWPNADIKGIGPGPGVGVDAVLRLSPRFGAKLGIGLEKRFEQGVQLGHRHESGALMEWLRAGVVFYPPEIA
jgi:hypothetical protein